MNEPSSLLVDLSRQSSVAVDTTVSILVISLSGSPRRSTVARSLSESCLPWCFFDGRRSAGGDIAEYRPDVARRLWGRGLSQGEVGCFASHLAALATFARDGAENAWLLVMEDDVVLDLGFDFAAAARVAQEAGIDYLRLYGRFLMRFRHVAWFLDRQIVRFRGRPLGTQAYLISRAGARAFVASVEGIERPVDHEIDRYWANGLGCYAIYPHPAIEMTSPSSVKKVDLDGASSAVDRGRLFGWRVVERLRRERRDWALRRTDARLREEVRRAASR